MWEIRKEKIDFLYLCKVKKMYQIIEGDLLTCTDSIICQQLNCLCVRAHGLSADIAKKYPYSNVYAERKAIGTRNLCIPEDAGVPGNIEVRSGFGPIVIGLYGQYDYGKGCTVRTTPAQDNAKLREIWFKQCLENLEIYMKHPILHMAGVTDNLKNTKFYKGDYININPLDKLKENINFFDYELIRENKIFQIPSTMRIGQEVTGMITMNQSLASLVSQKVISLNMALEHSPEPEELIRAVGVQEKKAG